MANSKPPEQRRDKQLLLRLTGDEFEIIDAAAHLSRTTPNAYAYDLLCHHIEALRSDPFITRDLANRHEFESSTATTAELARTQSETRMRRRRAQGDGS